MKIKFIGLPRRGNHCFIDAGKGYDRWEFGEERELTEVDAMRLLSAHPESFEATRQVVNSESSVEPKKRRGRPAKDKMLKDQEEK